MVNKNNGVGRLIPGIRYSVGLNDGKEFRRACYVGTKLLNGKPMMCFRTVEASGTRRSIHLVKLVSKNLARAHNLSPEPQIC